METKFIVKQLFNHEWYKIHFYNNGKEISGDFEIAGLLNMTLGEYEDIKILYGAEKCVVSIIFTTQDKAQKFVDYLNETYLIILRLIGKI